MSLTPLWDAGWVVALHAGAAMAALLLGIVQFAAPKGTLPHRTLGYVWAALMAIAAIASAFIHDLAAAGAPNLFGFSWIHLFTLLVAITLPRAVIAARRGEIGGHARGMIWLYIGGLLIAGAFTLAPGRVMHAVVFGAN